MLELFFILLNYHYVKKVQNSVTPHRSRMFGFLYELLGGIQKIRTNGAEERAFQLWAEHFAYTEPNSAYQPLMYTYSGSLAFVTKMLPMIITMWAAWSYKLALSDYIAYCAVLGIALDTVGQMETIMKQLGRVMPQARLCQPILEAVPEIKDNQLMITHLEGSINIIGLRFRYSKSDPWLFDGFDLHIEPGEFIGITGPSSCGKSTLLRLLLGFEDPTEGYIYYDLQGNRTKIKLEDACDIIQNNEVDVILSTSSGWRALDFPSLDSILLVSNNIAGSVLQAIGKRFNLPIFVKFGKSEIKRISSLRKSKVLKYWIADNTEPSPIKWKGVETRRRTIWNV